MLLPVAHERRSVGRLPWMTGAVILLCVLGHLQVAARSARIEESRQRFATAVDYYLDRPYLEPDSRLLPPEIKGLFDAEALERVARRQPGGAQQIRLDELTEEWVATLQGHPIWEDGLVPARFSWRDLFVHMFVHADWLHLLGNLLFLYLTGPFVEDRWGRMLFAAFYVVAGLVAGGGFAFHYPELYRPLVGASGAVAAVMGAFLVLFWRTRIRFVYWFGILVGTFRAPAWLMLPLWFVGELSAAVAVDRLAPAGVLGGVAYWAHVFGFAFGVVVALVLRRLGVERRLAEPEGEGKREEFQSAAVEAALKAQRYGRPEEALEILQRAIRAGGGTLTAQRLHWELALELGRGAALSGEGRRLIRAELEGGELDAALGHARQLRQAAPDPGLFLRLAESAWQRDRPADGDEMLRAAVESVGQAPQVGTVRRLLDVTFERDRELYRQTVEAALQSDGLPPDLRQELELRRV